MLATLPMAMLDSLQDVVQHVADDTADAYERLKERLMGSYGITDWQMIAELVVLPALGNLRPTQLMDARWCCCRWASRRASSSSTTS